MRHLLVGISVVGLVTAAALADDPKPAQNKDEIAKTEKPPVTLRGIDPAPPTRSESVVGGSNR